MNDEFFTDKEHERINPDLMDKCAQHFANEFLRATPALKPTQLRKFYNEVKSLELQLNNNPREREITFYKILPSIRLLKAKANYSVKRDVAPQAFYDWIDRNVNKVNELKDFEPFVLYFEALVGFYKVKDN